MGKSESVLEVGEQRAESVNFTTRVFSHVVYIATMFKSAIFGRFYDVVCSVQILVSCAL